MKKYPFIITLLLLGVWVMLPSCGSNPQQDAGLQAPETPQTAAQADTTAKAAKENEEDDDDDDKAKKNEKGQSAAATPTDAKAATIKNLLAAYAGETTASAKYAAYSKKAQEEGLTRIALLFKATSSSEQIHANNHKSVLEDLGVNVSTIKPVYTVKSTRENLMDAISGESYEIATMYPEFLQAANAADLQLALTSLNYAYRTEQRHKPLYEKALAALDSNQVGSLSSDYYVCPTCGNTYDSTPPRRCRISMTNSERMLKINAV